LKISDLLEKKGILIDLKAPDKTGMLSIMGRFLASLYNLKDADLILQKILDRESQVSTGIGYGIAIPHARMDNTDKVYMIAARCVAGIEFGAIDEQPVHIIFMMISPTNTATQFTGLLSKLSKIMSYEEMRKKLVTASDPAAFLNTLIDGENRYAP
jgi:mannitol/fructose-specific phosphotransferase system IIA component (Ntr-type)